MQLYRRKQVGELTLAALGAGVALTATLFILASESRVVSGVVLLILLLCMFLFPALTVVVRTDELIVSFGPGAIRKRFLMKDILGVRAVRNPWYYGWGIRLTPHGWMFNVSGLDAVELDLRTKEKFRIGTDDPQRLINAIQSARQSASHGG